jgi:hypothetical protein
MKSQLMSNFVWLCIAVLLLILSLISKNLWVASFGLVIFIYSTWKIEKLRSKKSSASRDINSSEINSKLSKFIFKLE